jgi:hypothetical protein
MLVRSKGLIPLGTAIVILNVFDHVQQKNSVVMPQHLRREQYLGGDTANHRKLGKNSE